jgi:hypothetical protein
MTRKILNLCALAAVAMLLSPALASAQVVRMFATLHGGNETPAPGLLTGAVGTAEVNVDTNASEIGVNLRLFNIPTGTTAGHIHAGAAGIAGPVIIDFTFPSGLTGDQTINLRLGQAAFRARPEIGIATLADAIQTITAGNAYVNIHTTQFPGGEIRGQLSVVTPR